MIYRRIAGVTVAAATVMSALALFGERQPLDRYQSIIDRQMFGPLPPNFDPTKSPSEVSAKDARAQEQELTKEQEQVKSSIHFSVINVTPAGDTAVGFTDNGDPKNPKHYYLKVGESRDGWTVKEADPLAASMTIAKGEIEVSLTIGGNSASGGGTRKAGSAPNGAGNAAAGSRPSLLGGARMGGRGVGLGSLRERRAQRAQQQAEAAQAAAEKERIAAEKEAQREAERAAEKEQREKEREEQRAQLLQIQEELRKAREERDKKTAEEGDKKGDDSEKEGDGE